jgi:hypothetical protein
MHVHRNLAYTFAVTGFMQAIISTVYDWNVLQAVPILLIPLIAICPLYPLLLGLSWLIRANGGNAPFLESVASISALGFALLAPLYFGSYALTLGGSLHTLGQVIWVAAYAIPGLYFIQNLSLRTRLLGLSWLAICLISHLITGSSGYLDLRMWSFSTQALVVAGTISAAAVITLKVRVQPATAAQPA